MWLIVRPHFRVASILTAFLLSGCSPFEGGNEEELREQARSFVPHGSRVVEKWGDCVELASQPSCLEVSFNNTLSRVEQERLVRYAAEENGWELTDARATAEVTWLWFEKDRLAIVRVYDNGGTAKVIA